MDSLLYSFVFILYCASGVKSDGQWPKPWPCGKSLGLNAAANFEVGKYFGTATEAKAVVDATTWKYNQLLNNHQEFGQITPTNALKWAATEAQQGVFTFGEGDRIAQVAASNGQLLRCHTLLWHVDLPDWVYSGSFDRAALTDVIKNHVTNVVQHYKGRCYSWDVVNEALNDDGSHRDTVFYRALGESYIPIAFAAAAAADPGAKLYYNDYSLEYGARDSSKLNGVKRIINLIRSSGARIDGVGFQGHFNSDASLVSTNELSSVMNSFTSMGLDVAITELDDGIHIPTSTDSINRQTQQYNNAVTACKNVNRCVGVTLWDFSDNNSWIPNSQPGMGSASPWDWNIDKKLDLYNAILQGWMGNQFGKQCWQARRFRA